LKSLRQILLSFAVTGLLVWLLLRVTGTQWGGVVRALRSVEWPWYLGALFTQLCIYPLRAARFASLLDNATWRKQHRSAGTAELIPVTLAHTLLAYLLPAKVGEASLLWYLKRGWQVPASRSLAVLLVARLLDLLFVCAFLCVACLVVGYGNLSLEPARMRALGWILVPVTLVLVVGLWKGVSLLGRVRVALQPLWRRTGKLGGRLRDLVDRLHGALQEVEPRALAHAALWSPIIWALVFVFYALLARGLGMQPLTFAQATFGAGLAVLFGLLPISAFAGFGSQDAGWVLGFVAVGVDRVLATEAGLAIHLIYALHIVVLGVLGHAWARRWAAERTASVSGPPV